MAYVTGVRVDEALELRRREEEGEIVAEVLIPLALLFEKDADINMDDAEAEAHDYIRLMGIQFKPGRRTLAREDADEVVQHLWEYYCEDGPTAKEVYSQKGGR